MRCIFSNEDQTTCIACRKKSKVCEEQRRENFPVAIGKKTSLKDRVAKLEALLETANNRDPSLLVGNESRNSDGSPQTQPSVIESTPPSSSSNVDHGSPGHSLSTQSDFHPVKSSSNYDPDPIVSLFNNAIWQQHAQNEQQAGQEDRTHSSTFMNGVQQRVTAKRSHVLTLLRSSLVPPHLLRDILNETSSWWQGWRPLGPWPREITTAARYSTLQDFLLVAYNSDNPPVVGLAVLCIAVSIYQLNDEKHFHLIQQLPRPAAELFQIYFERVDRLINTDCDFSSTKEGIECILMSAKLFEGLGLPKRAWLCFGKAVIYGQYLGLHRPYSSSPESEAERNRRYLAWSSLCQADLYLSLLLGLPYTADGRTIPAKFYGEPGTPSWFQRTLMDVAARLNDRNQMGLSSDIDITVKLQKDLDVAVRQMPAWFWDAPDFLARGLITKSEAIDCMTHQFFYHQIRVFLHMPLMLLSIENPHFSVHRLTCLDGCRGILRGYSVFRADCTIDVSSIIDYQAFISSALLLLGILGYGVSPTTFQEIDRASDRELIARTLETLKLVSSTSNNNIASQAMEGLQTLYLIAERGECPNHKGPRKDLRARIMIPYFGELNISPGDFLHKDRGAQDESQIPTQATFTLCHEVPGEIASGSQAQSQPRTETNSSVSNGMQDLRIHEAQPSNEQIQQEIASIDLDWNSLMNMKNDDWSWLAEFDNNEVAKFL